MPCHHWARHVDRMTESNNGGRPLFRILFFLPCDARARQLYTVHAYVFVLGYVGFLVWVLALKTVSPSQFH